MVSLSGGRNGETCRLFVFKTTCLQMTNIVIEAILEHHLRPPAMFVLNMPDKGKAHLAIEGVGPYKIVSRLCEFRQS
jgi:hypothetical protein